MILRDMTVFLDDTPAAEGRLRLAMSLARQEKAHLVGVCVVPQLLYPGMVGPLGTDVIVDSVEEAAQAQRESVERLWTEVTRDSGLSLEWRARRGPPAALAAAEARMSDLAVAGQVAPGEGFGGIGVRPEEIALYSGRPVLAVPYAGSFPTVGERPLIAWRPTREAVRAVHDALPFLLRSRRATILVVDPENPGTGDDLAAHLARHGVEASVERTSSADMSAADVVLSRAVDLGADLLVMGAYGHSRLRELVLGGMTREILGSMTLPVLMAH